MTYQEAIEYWRYDPTTGIIYWIQNVYSHILIGKPAGGVNAIGYITIGLHGRRYLAHRLVWLLHYGEWPSGDIDHRDHDRTNNRINNFRVVDHQTNTKNAGLSRKNKSGVTGVCWNAATGKWRAQVRANKKTIYLGTYEDFDDAVLAREEANRKYNFHPNHGLRRVLC